MTAEDFLKGQVILIDKPLKWSSFQVVNKIRWLLKKKYKLKKIKIGHAGTLDPLATGLLIICTGKMTKKISEFQGQKKTYKGTFYIGATTPSYDGEHPINAHFSTAHITPEKLETARKKFLGDILQKPPIFSALKKDGKRLYESARAGEHIEIKPRTVTIHHFTVEKIVLPLIKFEVCCSKGTYIRSLANDFGKSLESGAYLTKLRRTAIGDFQVKNAQTIENFEAILKNF